MSCNHKDSFKEFVNDIKHKMESVIYTKFAWLPKRLSSGKMIWFKRYYVTYVFNHIFYLAEKPQKSKEIESFSEDEYMWYKLSGKITNKGSMRKRSR